MSGPVRLLRVPIDGRLGDSGRRAIEHQEWLQLTLGRFLAPAALDPATGEVAYVLCGDPTPLDAARAEAEVAAFDETLERIRIHLEDLIAHSRAADAFLSLRTLLELRLPDPSADDVVHPRDQLLVLARWGLASGIRLRDLLTAGDPYDPGSRAARLDYLDKLRTALSAGGNGEQTTGEEAHADASGIDSPTLDTAQFDRGDSTRAPMAGSTSWRRRKWIIIVAALLVAAAIIVTIVLATQ